MTARSGVLAFRYQLILNTDHDLLRF